jgi:hypothetical protein
MYTVALANASRVTLQTSDGQQIGPGKRWESKELGDAWVSSQQWGTLNFLDLGDKHIPGDSKETWGVLISYQAEEVVGRYEGGGLLHVVFSEYGQLGLKGMDLRQVSLTPMILS